MSRLLLMGIGAVAAAGAFTLAKRTAQRWRQQATATAAADDERSRANFCTTLAGLGVSDRVARVVYDFFASKETPLDPGGVRPRPSDGLAEQHFVGYPDELVDVLGRLLSLLGSDTAVPAPAVGQIRTVADVAVWLEGQSRVGDRPA